MSDTHHRLRSTGILFACVVGFCLLLVGWWVFFLLRQSDRLDQATALVARGNTAAALRILGADENGDFGATARRLRLMFTSEGIVLGLLVLTGVFLLYRSLLRERRVHREQERFLTGATHHLKTPLATVRLGLESMLAGSMPEEKREHYLEAMLRDVDHLERDLSNLLAAGGLQSYRASVQLQAGDLALDAHAAADSMRGRCDAAGIELTTEIVENVPVARDREAMHLILHNLLDNAVKYSSRGDRVTLALHRNGRDAVLGIRDTGRGIPAEELPKVFRRFFRGSAREHKGGSGIGLFLVRELLNAHHGTIEARSAGRDQGTEFEIRLPLAEVAP